MDVEEKLEKPMTLCRNINCENEIEANNRPHEQQFCSTKCRIKVKQQYDKIYQRNKRGYNPNCERCGKPRKIGKFCSTQCQTNSINESNGISQKKRRAAKKLQKSLHL
jgi:hypothetical protein